jgi:hypothetical protein
MRLGSRGDNRPEFVKNWCLFAAPFGADLIIVSEGLSASPKVNTQARKRWLRASTAGSPRRMGLRAETKSRRWLALARQHR